MTRGNQRETDRARAAKRKGPGTAKDRDGLTALQRKERCECCDLAKGGYSALDQLDLCMQGRTGSQGEASQESCRERWQRGSEVACSSACRRFKQTFIASLTQYVC